MSTTPRPPEEPLCPRCGAPHSPEQEYCLECGFRLRPSPTFVGRLSAAWQRRFGWYPGDWVWRILLGFLIAVAGAAAAIALAEAGSGEGPLVATEGGPARAPTTAPETATVALPTVPAGTPTGPPETPTAPPPATTTAPRPGSLVNWPAGVSGHTVVLQSIPKNAGRSLALARARAASRAGLLEVGVLDSSRYASLHPGYYVVFSGIYTSRAQAERARQTASAKGFAAAYARQITR